MGRWIVWIIFTMLCVLMLPCCKPPEDTAKPIKVETPPVKEPTPAITLNVATLNLSKYGTRYEKQAIAKLAEIIKRENIDVLTLQGVTRYPDIQNRFDLIEELRKHTGMYQKFGETQNLSGRQVGNVVFSSYPIKTYENLDYKKTKTLATALSVSVDAGVGNIVVVSTLIPEHLTTDEKFDCITTLEGIQKKYQSSLFIVTGNVFLLDNKNLREFKLHYGLLKERDVFPQLLYLGNDLLKLLDTKVEETGNGKMIIYSFGLFNRQTQSR